MHTDIVTTQHLLFDSLPETAPARRPARRPRANAAEPIAVDAVREAVPAAPGVAGGMMAAPPAAAMMTPPAAAMMAPPAAGMVGAAPLPVPRPVPEPFAPEAMTNPELRALVQALPDLRLSYLVVEAARELKRRVAPDREDEDAGEPSEPNPSLLRAARLAVGELSGEDG